MMQNKTSQRCTHTPQECPQHCLLKPAENKLSEAHHHWHKCLEFYYDPEEFRISLNALLQSLRNVTFALQKLKSKLEDFDNWYSTEQARMKGDPVLKWLVDSRNRIKMGDLETHSENWAFLIRNYFDETILLKSEADQWKSLKSNRVTSTFSGPVRKPPSMTIEEIRDSFQCTSTPMADRERYTIYLERRWVDSGLPDIELLTALAYCFGQLREIIIRAHSLLPQSKRVSTFANTSTKYSTSTHGAMLPCMISTREYRSTRRHFLDVNEVAKATNQEVRFDPAHAREIALSERYGTPPKPLFTKPQSTQSEKQVKRMAEFYANNAIGILKSGEDHACMSLYFKNALIVANRVHLMMDGQSKRIVASEIALTALRYDADTVVFTSEVWMSPTTRTIDGTLYPASRHPERTESVTIDVVARSGAKASAIIPFRHISGAPPNRIIEIEDGSNTNLMENLILRPLMAAWGTEQVTRGAEFWRSQAAKNH